MNIYKHVTKMHVTFFYGNKLFKSFFVANTLR